jgi:hypothetical protein
VARTRTTLTNRVVPDRWQDGRYGAPTGLTPGVARRGQFRGQNRGQVDTTDDHSDDAVEPNSTEEHPGLPGCGPGGRGFESRRSPSGKSLQTGQIQARPEGRSEADGDKTGTKPRHLFRAFHTHLVRIVQSRVHTSPAIVDDACSFAWARPRIALDHERRQRGLLVVCVLRGGMSAESPGATPVRGCRRGGAQGGSARAGSGVGAAARACGRAGCCRSRTRGRCG